MPLLIADLDAMIAEPRQEGLHLDFKAGPALAITNDCRAELVKDVTGFANAAGGMLIYGMSETKNDAGIGVASGYSPVTEPRVNKEWISQVIHNNTSPRLSRFQIVEIALPQGGRAIVVEVQESFTAHQNLHDKLFYARAGATTQAMEGHQVRDVMNRRMAPMMEVQLIRQVLTRAADMHAYLFVPKLHNAGSVLLDRWLLEVDLPTPAVGTEAGDRGADPLAYGGYEVIHAAGWPMTWSRRSVSDPLRNGNPLPIHPGRTVFLDENIGLPRIVLRIHSQNHEQLRTSAAPLKYRLFMPSAAPLEGELAFHEWCIY